jgi:hypothetical protein
MSPPLKSVFLEQVFPALQESASIPHYQGTKGRVKKKMDEH